MMRAVIAITLGLAAMGAGPPPTLPVPPIPPVHPPAEQLAPMPDADARAPLQPTEQHIQVSVNDFRAYRPNSSLGYGPGSQFQTSEDKRPIQTPGFTVRVPLQ